VRLHRLSRSPLLFWAVVALLALLTATTVGRAMGRARAEAARWGSVRAVAVTTGPVAAGTVVRAGDVAVRSMPAAFLPEGAMSSIDDVVGRATLLPLVRGQAVVREALAPWGLKGLAALLPIGTRAVGVPTGAATPPLRNGDVVDVLATIDAPTASADPTFAVAQAALVVDVGSESATVAVSPAEANKVAYAVAHGAVSLAVTAGSPDRSDHVSAGQGPAKRDQNGGGAG